jgi:hypothetical protein
LNDIFSFNPIFKENIVPFHPVPNVLLYQQVMGTMYRQKPRERVVNRNTSNKAVWNFSRHMEMGAIAAYNIWLSAISKF